MKKLVVPALLAPLLVSAHPGHGMPGEHWHATDAWGFVALALLMGGAMWFNRRK